MKKIITALLLAAVILTGCSGVASNKAENEKLQVYTSFYTVYDIVNSIGGDKIDLYNIVPTGTEPHEWEPSVHDMAKLESFDILFYNGCGIDDWVDKVKASVSNDKAVYGEMSQGIADENAGDPHVWLSPINTKKMAEKAAQVLSDVDGENKEYYMENLAAYEAQLDELDKAYRDTLSGLPNKDIVVSHMAYSYMCSEYGLNQMAIDGINADSEPSPDKMKEIISFIKDNNVKYIFYEELLSQKTAQTIADETGASLLPLNPFEGLTEEQLAAGENYITVMQANLESLKTALGE